MATHHTTNRCPQCGHTDTRETVYCPNCGQRMKAVVDKTPLQLQQDALVPPSYAPTHPGTPFPATPKQPFWTRRKLMVLDTTIILLLLLTGVSLLLVVYQLGRSGLPGTTASRTEQVETPARSASHTSTSPATISPQPLPQSGTVLCQSGLNDLGFSDNWQGWMIGGAWSLSNGTLFNDGSTDSRLRAPSSCQPLTPDYAVEVKMLQIQGTNANSYGMIVRGTPDGNGYMAKIFADLFGATLSNVGSNPNFEPGTEPHLYRLDVKGNSIRLSVDGVPLISGVDKTFRSPGEIALFDDGTQLQVFSFRVIVL